MIDKQIEEIKAIILEDCGGDCENCEFHNKAVCYDNFIANRLYNAGYRKASDVAREIIEFIEDYLNRLIDNDAPSKSIANFIKIIKWHLCIKIEKKYESESNNGD